MDIFGDLWFYDADSDGGDGWVDLSGSVDDSSTNVITSLLFGTVGFALYACVIVCVFLRRWANYRGREVPTGATGRGGATGAVRQTLDPSIIAELPKMKWADVLRVGGATGAFLKNSPDSLAEGSATSSNSSSNDVGSSRTEGTSPRCASSSAALQSGLAKDACIGSSADEEQAGAQPDSDLPVLASAAVAALPTGMAATAMPPIDTARTDDDDDDNRCIVCAERYEPDDDLLWLPCHHIFHEECVKKWLLERSPTCPFCREVVVLPSHGSATSSPARRVANRTPGEQTGTELSALSHSSVTDQGGSVSASAAESPEVAVAVESRTDATTPPLTSSPPRSPLLPEASTSRSGRSGRSGPSTNPSLVIAA